MSEGTRVARGFADLGYEEFCVLSNHRLLSLFTGAITPFGEGEAAHLCVVPDADLLVDVLERRGWDIASLDFEERRCWVVRLTESNSGREVVARNRHLAGALAEGLIATI